MSKKYWVAWRTPGSFVSDEWTEACEKLPQPSTLKWPDNAYSARIFQQTIALLDGEKLEGKQEQIGPEYYHPNSFITTLEQLESDYKNLDLDVLLSNMRCNKWASVIWTRWSNWPQPYDAEKMEILK